MQKYRASIQFLFMSLVFIGCGSDDSHDEEKIEENIDVKSVRVEAEEHHQFQFEDGSIHVIDEEFYSDGSVKTLFKINNEIVLEKEYELPKFPEELSKLKAIITYGKLHVQDEVTGNHFTNKFKIVNHGMSRSENFRDKDVD